MTIASGMRPRLPSYVRRKPLPCAVVRLLAGALCASFVIFGSVQDAHAVPDGPLGPYLEHLEPFALAWPADGTVTDGFGPRWGRMHLGVDIGILRSLDVRAAAAGTVTEVGYLAGFEGYGNVVLVDVGDGYSTLYAHLTSPSVTPGEWLDSGDAVGIAGCTGSCTGTHLHFELRQDGEPIDPEPYLTSFLG
jgi:murein DD-endopeptidase MepM/ murein hydrolase activator NlpD